CVPTETALAYRSRFHEILIDEYQDSNLVQELLLKSISGEEEGNYNRFMVGDVKQSIYKFRLARPELFMEKYNSYLKEDSACQRIDLHKNFRSRPQVLASVNELFRRIMGRKVGGVEYDREAALYPGALYPDASVPDISKAGTDSFGTEPLGAAEDFAPGFFDADTGTSGSGGFSSAYDTEYIIIGKDEDSPLTAREQEAAVIAGKIQDLYRTFKVTDKDSGQMRPVRYSDMVILLRTTSGWAEEFKGILEKEGIPAYVSSRTGYFQTVEIKALMQYLNIIDNPLQDIPLYGALKSFFGGFSEQEIAYIRAENKRIPLYDRLVSHDGALRERIQQFLEKLFYYRQKTAYTPLHN
ncbi:MAG: UvrD-helicase domain-containing protein, partial [Lachnospiraceae bacterium]|nr:UvrD-helicase domain-containing protein [Lachnospiraceae bacterium]